MFDWCDFHKINDEWNLALIFDVVYKIFYASNRLS